MRITRLTDELAENGHHIRVLSRTVPPGTSMVREPGPGIEILRTSPGAFEALIDKASTRKIDSVAGGKLVDANVVPIHSGLNWKGRTVGIARQVMDLLTFADGRSAWSRGAISAGQKLIAQLRPDLLVASHEPAASLQVALALADRFRLPLLAELGDPVMAPYTPRHWRSRAFKLEAEVCRKAGAVVVTSQATAELLEHRHGFGGKYHVIPQGFSASTPSTPIQPDTGSGLHLVYTGRFYPFRDPAEVVQAVLAVPGCRLTVAGPALPSSVAEVFVTHPDRLCYLGQLHNDEAVTLQKGADLLLNIGNAGMSQLPGKLLEYLGAGRPVLHVKADVSDAAVAIVEMEQCGFVVGPGKAEIAMKLQHLLCLKQSGQLEEGLRLGQDTFAKYRWDVLAKRLEQVCLSLLV
ncbi:glycosyltransferase [Xanthomonas campestris]|uniref:glycosyltransferase n=1 Tax=Xanthomonas campestris TaxID=339 RepID=UPI0013796443|nr:glycosyltransferase [Xanthomonas campestris]MEB2233096.1 glycosyltransferase [Xanthomonas campestris pv. campestris]